MSSSKLIKLHNPLKVLKSMTNCDCSMCKQNAQFYQFRNLLPESDRNAFTQWYSDVFDALEGAETELAMQEHRIKYPRNQPLKAESVHHKLQQSARSPIQTLRARQINLGQLIQLLESVPDRKLPVQFQGFQGNSTLNVDSWRGSYDELAIQCDPFENITNVNEFLFNLKRSIDTPFSGWKSGSGEFVMYEETPLWVAGYGISSGFLPSIDDCDTQAITGIYVASDAVKIESAITRY